MRAFFAIMLSLPTQQEVTWLMDQLKTVALLEKVRWTEAHNLHITLQFLQHLEKSDLERLVEKVNEVVKITPAFYLELPRVELFPEAKHPRFISLQAGPAANLVDLAQALGQCISQLNYSIEKRPYRGHVTLGRLKGELIEPAMIDRVQLPSFSKMLVNRIQLVQSKPTAEGSIYTPINEFLLKL